MAAAAPPPPGGTAAVAFLFFHLFGPRAMARKRGGRVGVFCSLPTMALMAVRWYSLCANHLHPSSSTPWLRLRRPAPAPVRCSLPERPFGGSATTSTGRLGRRGSIGGSGPERLSGVLQEDRVADATRHSQGVWGAPWLAAGSRAPGGTRHSGRVHWGIPIAKSDWRGDRSWSRPIVEGKGGSEGILQLYTPIAAVLVGVEGWFKKESVRLVSRWIRRCLGGQTHKIDLPKK